MIILKLAARGLLRRARRMVAIGLLVFLGTLILVFGQTFANSAAHFSRLSVIDNFTGDFIVYNASSKEKPSPFAFTTPLPVLANFDRLTAFLAAHPQVQSQVPLAQNYSLLAVERDGKRIEVPLIYYAVEPESYGRSFRTVRMLSGTYFGLDQGGGKSQPGVLVSAAQNQRFQKNYGLTLTAGEQVTILGLTPGGSVNAKSATVLGVFEPASFKSIFDYINFIDIGTYAELYNFTGVKAGSLPAAYDKLLSSVSDDDIFALAASETLATIQVNTLVQEALSGYTMIAVKLKDHGLIDAVRAEVEAAGLEARTEPWDKASGFFAPIAQSLTIVIYAIVGLIFLIVTLIFMNTLIINVIERTHEIGTMRALGGEKRFVRNLFMGETLLLNGAFTLLGLLTSLILILAFGPGGLPLPDIVSQFLIGGGNLPLLFYPLIFVQALVIVVAASVLATIYPVRVATRISPLAAMLSK